MIGNPIQKPWPWFAALILIQALVFYVQIFSQISWAYPAHHDQLGYTIKTFRTIDLILAKGIVGLIGEVLANPLGTTLTFPLQGAVVGLFFGEGRAGFLSLNFIYFIALQLTLFATVKRVDGRTDAAWLAIALLMSFGTLSFYAGSLFDFRMDFPAMCLYGIRRSGQSRSRPQAQSAIH